jgi:hypothetical protein
MYARYALLLCLAVTSFSSRAAKDSCEKGIAPTEEKTRFELGRFTGTYSVIFPHKLGPGFSVDGRKNKYVFDGRRVWPDGTTTEWKWTEFEIMAIAGRFLSEAEFQAIEKVHTEVTGELAAAELGSKLNLATRLLPDLDDRAIDRLFRNGVF